MIQCSNIVNLNHTEACLTSKWGRISPQVHKHTDTDTQPQTHRHRHTTTNTQTHTHTRAIFSIHFYESNNFMLRNLGTNYVDYCNTFVSQHMRGLLYEIASFFLLITLKSLLKLIIPYINGNMLRRDANSYHMYYFLMVKNDLKFLDANFDRKVDLCLVLKICHLFVNTFRFLE